jgi:maltokinase
VVPGLRTDAAERAIGVDQTNTSLIVDDRLVVKIVGHWAAADRAAHLLERLADAGSREVAALHGRVDWRHPRLGTSTLAIVTEYLPGAEDGWTWAVGDVIAALDGTGSEPSWPALLGERTARMHDVLSVGAVRSGPDAPLARLERAADALARAVDAADPADRGVGARLANRRAALERDIRSLAATAPGLEFPIHGDLHVGQVLASPDADGTRRYTIIDFDGDPQLDAADRERADAAARDLAHLLVSLDLVAAVAQKRMRRADAARWAWAWADRARTDLLAAYRGALARGELLDDALLPGFEAEQLAAELHYAERFLPAWRYAPDAAITHRYPSTDEHPEDPWTPPPFAPTSS